MTGSMGFVTLGVPFGPSAVQNIMDPVFTACNIFTYLYLVPWTDGTWDEDMLGVKDPALMLHEIDLFFVFYS